MSARTEILARIRTALADRPVAAPVERTYRTAPTGPADLDRFAERVGDYRATVFQGEPAQGAELVAEALAEVDVHRVAVPDGFPPELVPDGLTVIASPFDVTTLDGVDGVLTTCAVAIAETGTIVLDAGPGQGPRAASLVPDYHLVVVRADQVVAGVPDAVARLDPSRPLTWISGPSATSDIELERVEGVHGPRTLHVVVLG